MIVVLRSLPRISTSHFRKTNKIICVSKMDPTIHAQTIAYIVSISIPHTLKFYFTPIDENEVRNNVTVIKSRAVGCDNISNDNQHI